MNEQQIRAQISALRKQLRGIKREKLGLPESIQKLKRIRARRHTKTIVRKGHEFLYGQREHTKRRIEIFQRAGGQVFTELTAEGDFEHIYTAVPATCELCETGHIVSWEDGHMVHMEKRHCDCLTCVRYGCKPAHAALHHNRIKWD